VRRRSGLLAAAFAASLSSVALANGRYPTASQIIVDPNDANHIVVSATFGFLDSRDGGKTFNWLCEAAVGPAAENGFDIVLAVSGNGNTVLGLFDGMAATRDGCTFRIAPELEAKTIGDLSWRSSMPHRVIGYTIGIVAGGYASQIVQSNDDGISWNDVGPPLPLTMMPLTIDLAESDTKRVYVSALADKTKSFASVLLRSDDGGATFETLDIPGTELHRQAYIAAVHPSDANRLYLRVLDDREGVVFTSIFMTSDGGRSFRKIFDGTQELFGFAISPDGGEIAFGGPGDGLYVGASDGSNLTRRSDVQPTALTWTKQGLYATADSKLAGFSIGRSVDAGSTFEGLFRYQSLCGTTACGARATALCTMQWDLVAPQFGVTCIAPQDAGRADATVDANPGGGGVDATPPGDPGGGAGEESSGCAMAPGRERPCVRWPFVLLAVPWAWRRLQRRASVRARRRCAP
jgi:photosystem II stability/assembly factor-like uncharacterized protein